MKKFFKNHFPVIISSMGFLVTLSFMMLFSLGYTGGRFIYLLDDSYIHMSVARNLAENGIWGIMGSGFASCSSSPLWTLLLAGVYFVFGYGDIIPFVLNVISALVLLYISDLFIEKYVNNTVARTLILFALIYFTPLTSLVFTGLEHTLYILVFVSLFYIMIRMSAGSPDNMRLYPILLLLIMFLVSLRYEGMFFVLPLSLYFLYNKKPLRFIGVLLAGAIPVSVMGVVSVSNGWYFLPVSVMLKSGSLNRSLSDIAVSFFSLKGLEQIVSYYHVLLISVILIVFLVLSGFNRNLRLLFPAPLSVILLVVIFLQAKFAKLGYMSRYEAYIVTAAMLLISVFIFNSVRDLKSSKNNIRWVKTTRIISVILLLIVFIPISLRAVKYTPLGIRNIYEQQYQTAMFTQKFYKGKTIAVNDIGAVSLYGGARTIDLWGLADIKYADAFRNNTYTKEFLENSCREDSVRMIAVYESWFEKERSGIPSSWITAGKWKIKRNIVCGDSIVTFYAQDTLQLRELQNNLSLFETDLSPRVDILK